MLARSTASPADARVLVDARALFKLLLDPSGRAWLVCEEGRSASPALTPDRPADLPADVPDDDWPGALRFESGGEVRRLDSPPPWPHWWELAPAALEALRQAATPLAAPPAPPARPVMRAPRRRSDATARWRV